MKINVNTLNYFEEFTNGVGQLIFKKGITEETIFDVNYILYYTLSRNYDVVKLKNGISIFLEKGQDDYVLNKWNEIIK